MLRLSTFVLVCFFMIACNSSDENEAGTNQSAITPLIVPADAPQTTATTAPTVYDIWVLDSINNKPPDSNFFSHGSPYLDFNVEKKTLTGHTGCNGITGKVDVQGEKLIFDSLVLTSQTCKNKDFERKFVNGFKSGKTTYKLLNGNLHLNIGSGTNLIFRKIRR